MTTTLERIVDWASRDKPSWVGHFLLASFGLLVLAPVAGIAGGALASLWHFFLREGEQAAERGTAWRRNKVLDSVIDWLSPVLSVMLTGTAVQLIGYGRAWVGLGTAFLLWIGWYLVDRALEDR